MHIYIHTYTHTGTKLRASTLRQEKETWTITCVVFIFIPFIQYYTNTTGTWDEESGPVAMWASLAVVLASSCCLLSSCCGAEKHNMHLLVSVTPLCHWGFRILVHVLTMHRQPWLKLSSSSSCAQYELWFISRFSLMEKTRGNWVWCQPEMKTTMLKLQQPLMHCSHRNLKLVPIKNYFSIRRVWPTGPVAQHVMKGLTLTSPPGLQWLLRHIKTQLLGDNERL